MPLEMFSAQAVVLGEKVYVGGGAFVEDEIHNYRDILLYNSSRDEWSELPRHDVKAFALAQFIGNLITVGGLAYTGATGKIYRFKEESQMWEEFLKPMPTARCHLTVTTTQSAIIASGGRSDYEYNDKPVIYASVEVYRSETSQWYTADPLPAPYHSMTWVTIADTCFLLGGADANNKDVASVLCASLTSVIQGATLPSHQSASSTSAWYASLTSLFQRATSLTRQSTSHTSVWKTLPNTPLMKSAAVTLGGSLLAVGGYNNPMLPPFNYFLPRNDTTFPSVNVFLPMTNSWVKLPTGDLPEPRKTCTAVQLSSNAVMVIGGWDDQTRVTKTSFIGTITV